MNSKTIKGTAIILVFLLLGTLALLEEGPLTTAAEEAPAVTGMARLEGPRPRPRSIRMTEKKGKPSDCRKLYKESLFDENLVVGKKGELANVFIYVSDGLKEKSYDPPKKSALMDQDRCMFKPRVQGIQVGQDFLMKNSDPLIHNVRSFSMRNRPFNIAQPPKTPDRKKVFKRKEKEIMIQCDFHPWMKAYLFVMDHPYFAVTNAKGEYSIKGLPPGKYTLTAWHEELGEQEAEITVDASGAAKAGFTFKAKKK